MKSKILTIIFGMILLIGIVAAANTLSNLQGIKIPPNVVAGNTFIANFSFDYLADGVNEVDSPFIIKLNFNSDNSTNYPVWKNDFQASGIAKKCTWTILETCILPRDVSFTCSETAPLTIINPIDTTTINTIPNGTFYCYNAKGDLKLNEHDEVFLNITSHPALYPSQYTLMAEMFYLNDTTSPFVQILNKNDFDRYYKVGSYVNVKTNITEGRSLGSYSGTIYTSSANYTYPLVKDSDGFYYFRENLPNGITEGNYLFNITAVDTSGNVGTDNVTLKIDLTAPTIELVSPANNSVVSEIIPLKINVTDAKSGVDNSSVYYRLREIVNGQICPEFGVPLGNYSCTRTDWLNLPYIQATGLFEKDVNTTKLGLNSGEYWLEAKAKDLLGNERQLE